MGTDTGTEIVVGEVKRDLGIRDDEREADTLRPVAELQTEDFERSIGMGWLTGENSRQEPLQPAVIERARLAVEVYKQALRGMRPPGDDSPEYGAHAKVVGKVRVSSAGPEGRYLVSLTTTNVSGEDDWRATASTLMFDEASRDLDQAYPAREGHLIYGEREGRLSIVGNYRDLLDRSGGKVTESLAAAGWQNPGEVWAADLGRHAGTITPPSNQ